MIPFNLKTLTAVTLFGLASANAMANPFSEIRIGDKDGFGYNADAHLSTLAGAQSTHADINGDGKLTPTDVLPDLNKNHVLATGAGDDFDNRNNEHVTANGAVDNGTQGAKFTDISLSTSYDASAAAGNVYNANTHSTGGGGVFPAGTSASLPNQPGFLFNFFVNNGDVDTNADIFFNMVFGDYDVTPAQIDFTFAGGAKKTLAVTPQNSNKADGLIQGAFATLAFSDVFKWDASQNAWHGFADIDFVAPNEPFTAFDYVELSVTPIKVETPETSPLMLLLLGVVGLVFARRRANKA